MVPRHINESNFRPRAAASSASPGGEVDAKGGRRWSTSPGLLTLAARAVSSLLRTGRAHSMQLISSEAVIALGVFSRLLACRHCVCQPVSGRAQAAACILTLRPELLRRSVPLGFLRCSGALAVLGGDHAGPSLISVSILHADRWPGCLIPFILSGDGKTIRFGYAGVCVPCSPSWVTVVGLTSNGLRPLRGGSCSDRSGGMAADLGLAVGRCRRLRCPDPAHCHRLHHRPWRCGQPAGHLSNQRCSSLIWRLDAPVAVLRRLDIASVLSWPGVGNCVRILYLFRDLAGQEAPVRCTKFHPLHTGRRSVVSHAAALAMGLSQVAAPPALNTQALAAKDSARRY